MREPHTAEALHQRLTMTAEHLRQKSGLTDHQLATVFMAVGTALATEAHGPFNAAEWLRDVADATEVGALERP
jgi:hypothetical protein